MNKYFRIIFANISSLLITSAMVAIVAYFSILTINNLALTSDGDIESSQQLTQSERVDQQELENELNKIAEKKRKEAERIAKEKADQIAREKAKADRIAKEKADQIAREKAKADRIAKEKADQIAREKAKADRIAKEKAEADRVAKEKAEADRVAKEKAEADRIAKEKAEADRIAKEKAEADRIAKEKAEADRIAKEKADSERQAKIHSALNANYNSQVLNYLYSRWIVPIDAHDGLSATIRIRVNKSGIIIGDPTLIKSSGNEKFDQSVIQAIRTAKSIPMPDEPLAREHLAKPDEGFEITFRPEHL